jgi:ribosomal protein S18 acetylase RimI-like enzyme
MPWKFSTDIDEYVDAAWPVLASDPIRNTIGLTAAENARRRSELTEPAEQFGWWVNESGVVGGCVSITPPWPLLLVVTPDDSMAPLVELLAGHEIAPVGVNGPNEPAATFGALWNAATGQRAILHDAIRLFELRELVPTTRRPAGTARRAGAGDVPLLADWYKAFGIEVNHPLGDGVENEVRERLESGGISLWCDAAGEIVSMVGYTGPVVGVSRIGPVYTPPDHRGKGYAEALTHDVSEDLLTRNLRVVLHTDQANPTSNALYQRLGYVRIMDRMTLDFEVE